MMLMSLLLALIADRYWPRHTNGYLAAWYARLVPRKNDEQPVYSTGQQLSIIALPALLLGGGLWLAESFLLTFVIQTLILFLALGKVDIKRTYRRYLEAGPAGRHRSAGNLPERADSASAVCRNTGHLHGQMPAVAKLPVLQCPYYCVYFAGAAWPAVILRCPLFIV